MNRRDDELRIRPGRIRVGGGLSATKAKSFIARALAATEKAGGLHRAHGGRRSGAFGRGRAASLAASRSLTSRSRGVVIKARVVRHGAKAAPLGPHVAYLKREGASRDGEAGRLFDAGAENVEDKSFAERCDGDRHHFRFIVSPEDAPELADLKTYTRELMADMTRDLGTQLDWVAVEHWNTEHPHVHVLVRGRADDGADLVIGRDYISKGLRARAEQLATLELGPRSEQEIRRGLERQVEVERFTPLDRSLVREAARHEGLLDLRPGANPASEPDRQLLIGRARKLERLGLATPVGSGRWQLPEETEPTLRALGERGDVIKTMHRALHRGGIDRSANIALHAEAEAPPIVGRLVERGLHDELTGSAYAVIDGTDGRAHHVRLRDLEATGDGAPGAVVELRRFEDRTGAARVALAVRSDLSLEAQITAPGATWLDRQAVSKGAAALSDSGFGREVRAALEARTEHLVAEGFANRQGQRVLFARDLLGALRRRELSAACGRIAAETGLAHHDVATGEHVSGVYRRRLTLASGRFAMLDDGLGFQLVPWSPSLEKQLGRHVSGVATPGGVDWSFGRKKGLGL